MNFNNETGLIDTLQTLDCSSAPPAGGTAGVLTINGTGALVLPTGNNSQQPSSTLAGQIRWNSQVPQLEFSTGSAWVAVGTSGGSVTSVTVTGSTGLTIGGSPITTSGTITLTLGTELQGLSALSANGFVQRTGAGTYTSAALTSGQITTALTYTPVSVGGGSMTSAATLTFSGGGTVTGLPTPVNSSDAAPKSYVDASVAGLSWKEAVVAATTTAGTLATSFANTSVIDGVTLATGNRILIKNQASVTDNGIYVVNATGAPTRSTDANTGAELLGATVYVEQGTINANTGWSQTTTGTITIGSTNIVFAQFSGSGAYAAGSGLTLTGNTFSLTAPVTTALGGTGLITTPTNGQLLIGNGSGYTLATITGTTNQLTVTNSTGSITLSLPAAVTITTSLTISALTANSFLYSGTAGLLTSTTAPTNGQLLIGSTGAAPVAAAITGTANQLTVTNGAGSITLSVPSTFIAPGSVQVTSSMQVSATNTISAAGTTQGTATALTTDYNVVTTTGSGTGVVLPTPSAGRSITVVNRGANALLVYPASSTAIDGLGNNTAVSVPANQILTIKGISSTLQYVTDPTFASGTAISVTATNGVVTYTNTGVTAIAGTTNQITASASTGSVTLSLPSAVTITTSLTISGLTVNSFLYSGTAGLLTSTTAPTNGQLLIGSTGAAPVAAAITQGTGITVTNGAGSITIANAGVTALAGTANQITASASTGSVTLSTSSTFIAPGSVQVTSSMQVSATNTISAAGTSQGTATALTTDYNVVTTTGSGTGVVLPAALSGRTVTVVNRGANALLVYPASGAAIDALSANLAVSVPVGQIFSVEGITSTQWYTTDSVFAVGTGLSVSSAAGTTTFTNTGVTSVALADGSSTTIYTVSGSPVTTTGTLTFTLKTQNKNLVFAGPTTGSAAQPTFRSLVQADVIGTGAAIQLYSENPSSPTLPTTSGTNAVAIGNGASATATNSIAHGAGTNASVWGGQVSANGDFATAGDSQRGSYIVRAITTDATANVELFLDGSGASQRMVMPNNSAWTFDILIVARRTDATGGSASWKLLGSIRKDATAASTTLVGTISDTTIGYTSSSWTVTAVADTTNGSLKVQVTGVASQTIRWVAVVNTAEVTN